MKLLFDENLSPRLVQLLNDLFPDSVHVRDVGLMASDDLTVWKYAQENSLIICSKDSDMHQRSFLLGFPPESYVGAIRQLFHFGRGRIAAETLCIHRVVCRGRLRVVPQSLLKAQPNKLSQTDSR
jgi:hypothetical protein